MLSLKIQIIVEKDENSFHAYCPALRGLHVDGDTVEEAFDVAKDAVVLYVQSLIEHGDPIPVGKKSDWEEICEWGYSESQRIGLTEEDSRKILRRVRRI